MHAWNIGTLQRSYANTYTLEENSNQPNSYFLKFMDKICNYRLQLIVQDFFDRIVILMRSTAVIVFIRLPG